MTRQNVLNYLKSPPKSKFAKFVHFFSTKAGRKISFFATGTAAVAALASFYLPQTCFIDYYRDFIGAYSFGIPIEVPEELKKQLDVAAEKLDLSTRHKLYLKSFVVSGFDIKSIGSLNSVYGGWVGIPANYFYKSVHDVDRGNIMIRNEPVKWRSEYGQLLERSLVLSDDEQMFGLLRSVLELKNYKFLYDGSIPAGVIIGIYTAGQAMNLHFNLFALPLSLRCVVYTMLSLFGYGVYSFLTDGLQNYRDTKIDKKLAELGPEIIDAGIHFYEKILNKNVAIRELSGENLYTAKGNEHFFLRTKALPLTTRKLFFEQAKQCLEKQSKVSQKKDANEVNTTEPISGQSQNLI